MPTRVLLYVHGAPATALLLVAAPAVVLHALLVSDTTSEEVHNVPI
jgi:hypothetical protein